MHLKNKNITTEEARLIESYAKKCMKLLIKKEYELDIPRGAQHRIPRFKGKWQKPHGEAFRTIYRYLRQDLVNGSIAQSLENKNFFEKR